jgi:hypothetical protein
MVSATGAFICQCTVSASKIVFCRLHQNAENLLMALSYVQQILFDLKPAAAKDEMLLRQVVLPYVDRIITEANGKSGRP